MIAVAEQEKQTRRLNLRLTEVPEFSWNSFHFQKLQTLCGFRIEMLFAANPTCRPNHRVPVKMSTVNWSSLS